MNNFAWWDESNWKSVWTSNGGRIIGLGFGGEFVQKDGRIELRFPIVCQKCKAKGTFNAT